jgi:phospholipase C
MRPEANMAGILPNITNIVVVMLENRSLDNLCGWIYSPPANPPNLFLPRGSSQSYDGLTSSLWNPRNKSYFQGTPPQRVPVVEGATNFTVPNPDPEETFDNVTEQIFGPPGSQPAPQPMLGFLVNYQDTKATNADQIMQTYSPSQVPVLTALARNYAVSDAWFCSVPSQTWPNRSFVHTGTSNGNVNNGEPLRWNVATIFNVLNSLGKSFAIYSDTILTPSLTRTMFPKLWDPALDSHFRNFQAFQDACGTDSLPQYSFLEPSFLQDPNDQHPPHDVTAGEQFLHAIWTAVSGSPGFDHILLVILYDEHGGCYDHVAPPSNAVSPDAASSPGKENFAFNRFGIRIPAVVVSPYVQAGTVFRSNTSVPHDHTSVLATLRDWLSIPPSSMLPSKRIAAAPTLEHVLTLAAPRTSAPTIPAPSAIVTATSPTLPLNDLQKSLVTGMAQRFGMDPAEVLSQVQTRQHAIDFFKQRPAK